MSKKSNKPETFVTRTGSYPGLLADIKQRIRAAQVRTAMAGNASMLMLYWEIGGVLAKRQKKEGWGAAVLPKLAGDLHNDLPEIKGFSARNMRRMIQFHQEYPGLFSIWPPPVAQLPGLSSDGAIWPLPVAKLKNRPAAVQKGPLSVAQLRDELNEALAE
jgi:hypothetical protein